MKCSFDICNFLEEITRWLSHGHHQMVNIKIRFCSQRWRSFIQSAKTRPEADCGSDHELLIAKFRLQVEESRKTTRPFRYDLKQIPYDYTVDLTSRFTGLALIDKVQELWIEVCNTVQEVVTKTIPNEKCKKANGCLRRLYK